MARLTICVGAVVLFCYASDGLGSTASSKASPAAEAFAGWVRQQGNSAAQSANAQVLTTGVELARARQLEMRVLMETDPQEFARRAMSTAERSQLPAQLQPLVEQRLTGRGSFSVMCVFPKAEEQAQSNASHKAGYAFEVALNGLRYRAFVYGPWRDQQTVAEAEIDGIALGDAIVLGDAPTPSQQGAVGQLVTGSSPSTTGPNTLLYMIARFSDQVSDPITEPTVLSQMTVVSNFWINGSGGKVYIKGLAYPTQVVDIVHITLPQPSSYGATYNNNFAQLLSDARAAASAQGYNYANYNLDVVVTTSGGFSYAGISYIGAQGSHWVTPYTTLRTAGHELGHNLGLWHANYWRTDSTRPFGQDSNPGGYVADTVNGEWVEYGHYFSVMSAQYGAEWDDATKPIYNPAEKVQIGWLSGSQVQYVTTSGTYRMFRHDAESTVGTPRAIRIETPATDYTGYGRRYWLQYRYAPWNTAFNWYQNGLEVDVAQTGYGSDGSIQLDMSPYSNDQSSPFYNASSPPGNWWTIDNNDKLDGALLLGRSYDDTAAGIHVTPIAKGNNGTGEEYLDVVINLGTFASDRAPVINSFSVSTNQVSTGQAVNFSISATDPDGDTLAYSWNFDDAPTWTVSGLNSASASKSWPSAGQYRVVATVSDMKGGITTAATIITVAQPSNRGQIWGRVLWTGQPVYGARVSTPVGANVSQAWTESDGSYVLTDLPTNASYTVSCAASGLTFTPQFTNPVPLASGAAYGIDFYANQALPTGVGNAFVISGQVTDPVNGAAGVEVRGAGIVTTTDGSGNYQLTNILNGTYTVAPSNSFWTFSPASRSVTVSSANSTGNNFSRVAPYSVSGAFTNIPAANNSPAPTVYLSNGRSVTATRGGTGGNRYWIYTLNNVAAGQYSVTAELSGYSIVPSGFSNPLSVSGSVSGVNFIGSAATIAGAISGRVTQYGLPLSGVTVSALQGVSTIGSASTDSDGWYRIDNLPGGAYTVTPSLSGFSFTPSSISVGTVPSSGNNFAAHGSKNPPTISSITASPAVVPGVGSTTTLSAAASGSGPLTYSWNALAAAGPVAFTVNDSSSAATTSVSFQAPGGYTFRAKVIDTNGFSATSNINVTVSAGPGSLVVAPYEVQVAGGQTVAFRADAWDQLGNPITLSPSWSVAGGGTIDSSGLFTALYAGGPYAVTATSGGLSATGSVWVTSSASGIPPSISTQPAGQTVVAGTSATFLVVAGGSSPLSYQWRLNGNSIGGATTSTYTKNNAQTNDAGTYSVLVTNSMGQMLSSGALLKVQMIPAVTWSTPASITYGTALGAGQLNASSVVAGSFVYSPSAGTVLNAGNNQTLSATFKPTDTNSYTQVTTNVSINVLKATPSLTWNTPAPINYGTPLGSTQLNATASVPGSFVYTPTSGTVLNAGTNSLSVTFTPSDALDFNSVTGSVAQVVILVYGGINLSDTTQALADPDGDGLANLAEYALGTDPHNSADAQTGMIISMTNNAGSQYLVLQFKRRHDTSAFPLQYVPEVSADGTTWFSDGAHVTPLSVSAFDAQFDWVKVQDTSPVTSATPRFIRLRVVEN
ncbi:MAG TPA: carboxypeptidase regulatory-like domain-containing protein [Candidatus Limnocylindrales bacterium]|nr:carboxypeptidase regulatory-like domain-containing protein [Candidatus Limnocylindrales bacterium]